MFTMMQPFRFEKPRSLKEWRTLTETLGKEKDHTILFCAGGTDIIPLLKTTPQDTPQTLISLTAIEELGGVKLAKDKVVEIGPLTTLCEFSRDPIIQKHLPVLGETASTVASPQLRNRATVGGNILVNTRCNYFNQSEQNRAAHEVCFKAGGEMCHIVQNATRGKTPLCQARFASDLAPVMLILYAKLNLLGPDGKRSVKLREFYLPDGIECNRLKKGELLTSIEIAIPSGTKLAYNKLRIRNAIDFPSLGVSVSTTGKRLAIALTGVNTRPLFMQFEDKGFSSKQEMIDHACDEATRAAQPFKQDFFPPSYRKQMVAVLIRRNLQKLGC